MRFRPAVLIRALALALALGAAPGLAPPAAARPPGCAGTDLIAALPEAERAELRAAADAVPYPQGNFWRATRDGMQVHLIGTYHLDDPRHAATVAATAATVAGAARLLVEAGPEEEAALKAHVGRRPDLVLLPDGDSLPDLLGPAEWAALAEALRARGLPGFMAARFRPWYVSVLLSVPPCAMPAAAAGAGLDRQLMDLAAANGVPVSALEPYDTAFRIFETMPMEAQLSMIRSTMLLEAQAEDQMETLAAAYFRQDSRIVWEFLHKLAREMPGTTPERAAADFALMEEALMNGRNRAWIPVIEAAAAEGPVVAAFGALHLSGREGVLNLMAQRGWTLERLPL